MQIYRGGFMVEVQIIHICLSQIYSIVQVYFSAVQLH